MGFVNQYQLLQVMSNDSIKSIRIADRNSVYVERNIFNQKPEDIRLRLDKLECIATQARSVHNLTIAKLTLAAQNHLQTFKISSQIPKGTFRDNATNGHTNWAKQKMGFQITRQGL